MNGLRILGQILLWSGFLSAALAACSRKEYDFLPKQEKESLARLVDNVSISQAELATHTSKDIAELTSDELELLCVAVEPVLKARAKESEKLERLTSTPIDELSVDELDDYERFVLPILKAKAAERAAEDLPPTEEAADEKEDKPVVKTYGKKEFAGIRTSLIENKWPTVNWPWYALSMVFGLAGVVLLRKSSKSAVTESTRVAEEYSVVTTKLEELTGRIGELHANLDRLAPQDVVNFIDEMCFQPFADFADARNALVQRFGLHAFAEVMTQFASAERFLNRAWSAAADGYMNETKDSVNRSNAHITRARDLLKKYESEYVAP